MRCIGNTPIAPKFAKIRGNDKPKVSHQYGLMNNTEPVSERLQAPFDKYEHWRKVAKVLKLSKSACQRLEWIIFYETKGKRNAKAA